MPLVSRLSLLAALALVTRLASAHGASAQKDDDSPGGWVASTKTVMQKFGGKIAIVVMIVLATVSGLAAIAPAFASKPMPKTIVGCVVNGAFIASVGYSIHPRYADGREADLRSFEGRMVTIKGALLPGDRMIINKPPRDSGRCKTSPSSRLERFSISSILARPQERHEAARHGVAE